MKIPDAETRIFARFSAHEPVLEVASLQQGGSHDSMLQETLSNLPENARSWITFRAVDPDRICARIGRQRLRCDRGRVRQDFAAIQAQACEPGVMFV